MAISLYDATVRSYLQGLSAMGGFLAKGLAHCQSAGIGPDTLVETRLYEDMLPFRFQVQAAAHHSWGALQAMIKGEFAPPPPIPAIGYAELQAPVAEAKAGLDGLTPRW